jgi:hypothetical protein
MSELVELGRRLKRSLDGYISYRRAAAIALITLGTVIYFSLMDQTVFFGFGSTTFLFSETDLNSNIKIKGIVSRDGVSTEATDV